MAVAPRLTRQLALGCLGAGAALFVVATIASATTSGATPTGRRAAHREAVPMPAPASSSSVPTTTAGRLVEDRLTARPVHSKRKAPATVQVISGLAANGIPEVALNAYRVAAARMGSADPSCGIDWALLAGIGREESDHGRFAGAVLHADGTSTPRIVGPALDGTHSDYIAAPPNGLALDGDAKYTHALGPMQFIPQTWSGYGTDADGDGIADIFDINDAALSAARYLCAAGGDLRTRSGQVAAVLAYNHNDEYLAQVLALAQAYRTGVAVSGVPVGRLTGALPAPPATTGGPGVNPGAPTAVEPRTSRSRHRQAGARAGRRTVPSPGETSTAASAAAPTSGGRGSRSTSGTAVAKGGVVTTAPGVGPTGGPASGPTATPTSGPSPTPSPTASCKLGIGGACLIP